MDVQAILDGSDDSSSGGGGDHYSYHPQIVDSTGNSHVDLEQILREDDDDDDEDVDGDVDDDDVLKQVMFNNNNNAAYSSPSNRSPHGSRSNTYKPNSSSSNPASTGATGRSPTHTTTTSSSVSATSKLYLTSVTSAAHSAEDWAVLQALLNEGEEDDDDDDDAWIRPTLLGNNNNNNSRQNSKSQLATKSRNVDVEAILLSEDEDDDDDDDDETDIDVNTMDTDFVEAAAYRHRQQQTQSQSQSQPLTPERTTNDNNADWSQDKTDNKTQSTTTQQQHQKENVESQDTSPTNNKNKNNPNATNSNNYTRQELSEAEEGQMSNRAMSHAQLQERKLLKAGQRDIVSPLMVKRRLKQKIELGTRMQKKVLQQDVHRSFVTTPVTRFNFSNVVQTRPLSQISGDLRHMKSKLQRKNIHLPDIGLPTAIAVNSKFIAVGTQGGIIFVFDLFEVLRQVLVASAQENDWGLQQNKAGSITSVDLHMNDEVLVAGHTSGVLVLWDTIKGVMLRSVTDAHPSPITSVRFLSELRMVTVDAGGLVNKLTFSKNMLWSTYSMETECLLDGTAGQILAMNVLPPLSTVNTHLLPTNMPHSMRQLVLIALSSERSSFAVAVEPSVNVLHRWARPPMERIEGNNADVTLQTFLPCLSWGWALVSGGGNKVSAILARAWGCCIQLLIANFPTLDDAAANETTSAGNNNGNTDAASQMHWPAFGVHDEFDVSDPVVALEWLNDRSLVYLTVTSEFTVVDTVMMTLLERLDFSGLKLVYAEFSLNKSASTLARKEQENAGGDGDNNTRKLSKKHHHDCTTFQNSIRSSDERLLILCQEELKFISIVGAKKRIASLEEDGEWLEALAVALDHYENTISSQEDRRRDPAGRKDLSRHPEFLVSANKSEEEEWISRLLLRYLHLAVENAPEPTSSFGAGAAAVENKIDLAQSHFQMLAGVCVEFCVVTRRLDLLFGPIFRRFRFVGYTSVFLDVLEPYVLTDKLNYIAPEAMTFFVEHCKATNGIATVERCLLHMDVTIMDFDSILTLLRKNHMYSALFYVFNQGLDDYITPLEILLEQIFDAADEGCARLSRRRDGLPQNDFEKLGYKAILYLRTCFQGKTFPQESQLQPEERLGPLRAELLRFLLREHYTPSPPHMKHSGSYSSGHRSLRYPYAHILLMVDARVVLDTISLALDAPGVVFARSESNFEAVAGGWEVEVGVDTASEHGGGGLQMVSTNSYSFDNDPTSNTTTSANNQEDDDEQDYLEKSRCPDMQRIIGMLTTIIIPEETDDHKPAGVKVYKSKTAVNAFLDFISRYMMKRVVRVSKFVTYMIMNRMAELFTASLKDTTERQTAQRQIIDLLNALPRNSYEAEDVLKLMERSGIHRAALLLHQEGASWHYSDSKNDPEERSKHFSSAIDCYLEDEDPLFRLEVFDYVKKECSGMTEEEEEDDDNNNDDGNEPKKTKQNHKNNSSGDTTPGTLRNALANRLPDLVHLDALRTAELVAELFVEDLDRVVKLLDAADDRGDSQFMFFQTIISGSLNDINPVAGAVLNANLAMEHHHKYLALMARLHPDMVYEYLSTHDNYRPEECLKLCQRHEIADASAYLLERMGNVSSALQLILQTLESRMMALKRTIRGMGLELFRSKRHPMIRGVQHHDAGSIASSSSPIPLALHLSTPTGSSGFTSKQEKEVEGVKRILIVALDLCERNSKVPGGVAAATNHHHYYRHNDPQQHQHGGVVGGSQLWFNVVDRLINAKGFLRLSKEQQEHADVMADVLSELLRMTMQRMVSNVPLTDLVRKVTSDNSGSQLGELREMIEVLLGTYKFELNVFKSAVNVFHQDVHDMHYKNRCYRRSGNGVSTVLQIPLQPNHHDAVVNNNGNKNFLEKTASDTSCILKLASGGGAIRATDYHGHYLYEQQQQQQQHLLLGNRSGGGGGGLANAMSKLRSRRGNNNTMEMATNNPTPCSSGLNLMTAWERDYNSGDLPPIDFGERFVGILGEAEHRGRLMSFM